MTDTERNMTNLTDKELDRMARRIYDAVTVQGGYTAALPYGSLPDHKRITWRRAATEAWREALAIAAVKEAGRIAAGWMA